MDTLSILDHLDKQDQKKKPVDVRANTKKNAETRRGPQPRPSSARTSRPGSLSNYGGSTLRPTPSTKSSINSVDTRPNFNLNRPTSLPSNDIAIVGPALSTKSSFYSERAPSTRRISFIEPRQVTSHRLQIATKTESLSSGFPYDTRLFKWGVTAEEWNNFSSHILEAAQVPLITHVPVLAWTWAFHKQKVTKGVKKQMLYESSDLMRELRRWNKLFKRQGFQARLELPNTDENDRSSKSEAREREIYGETKEDRERVKMESKRFRMILTPNAEKASSIYSRSSKLSRSVSGEGAITTRQNIPIVPVVVHEEERSETEAEADEAQEREAEVRGAGDKEKGKGSEEEVAEGDVSVEKHVEERGAEEKGVQGKDEEERKEVEGKEVEGKEVEGKEVEETHVEEKRSEEIVAEAKEAKDKVAAVKEAEAKGTVKPEAAETVEDDDDDEGFSEWIQNLR